MYASVLNTNLLFYFDCLLSNAVLKITVDIVSGIINNLKMILSIWICAGYTHTYAMLFQIRHLIILGFGYLCDLLKPTPCKYQGTTKLKERDTTVFVCSGTGAIEF